LVCFVLIDCSHSSIRHVKGRSKCLPYSCVETYANNKPESDAVKVVMVYSYEVIQYQTISAICHLAVMCALRRAQADSLLQTYLDARVAR